MNIISRIINWFKNLGIKKSKSKVGQINNKKDNRELAKSNSSLEKSKDDIKEIGPIEDDYSDENIEEDIEATQVRGILF